MSHALGSKPAVQWLNLFTVRQVLGMIPCVAITGSCEPGKPAVRELRVAAKSMGSCVTSAALSASERQVHYAVSSQNNFLQGKFKDLSTLCLAPPCGDVPSPKAEYQFVFIATTITSNGEIQSPNSSFLAKKKITHALERGSHECEVKHTPDCCISASSLF